MPVEGLLGKKIGMTQVYREDGTIVPVSVVEAGPNHVTQVRTVARDGYEAVQLGFGDVRRLNQPERGHLKRLPLLRHLREMAVKGGEAFQVGQKIDASMFKPGDLVDVTGVSLGKGFAGVVKRHHFAGGPRTHGQSDRHRAPGSVGAGTTPGRVLKGMRMAGHMGAQRVTVQNLEVVQVDPARNLLLIKGAVPGTRKGLLMIKKSVKSEG